MPVQPCPVCKRPVPILLKYSSKIAYVNYYVCEACHHIWTTNKQTGEFARHVTPLYAPFAPQAADT